MEPKTALLLMRLGMLLIIVGALIFFFTGDHYQPIVSHMIVWGCGCATAIYFAGLSAINELRDRVQELRKKEPEVSPVRDIATNLREIHALLR
jgi:flagellar basal body-associated protein FliL